MEEKANFSKPFEGESKCTPARYRLAFNQESTHWHYEVYNYANKHQCRSIEWCPWIYILSSRIVFNCLDAELSRDELTKVESLESLWSCSSWYLILLLHHYQSASPSTHCSGRGALPLTGKFSESESQIQLTTNWLTYQLWHVSQS